EEPILSWGRPTTKRENSPKRGPLSNRSPSISRWHKSGIPADGSGHRWTLFAMILRAGIPIIIPISSPMSLRIAPAAANNPTNIHKNSNHVSLNRLLVYSLADLFFFSETSSVGLILVQHFNARRDDDVSDSLSLQFIRDLPG